MNLFCFSLEGSTDSLYRPVEHSSGSQESGILPSRPSSPRTLQESAKWCGSDPCISTKNTQEQSHTSSLKKAKRKSHNPGARLSKDNETLDCSNAYWQMSRQREDWIQINQALEKDLLQARLFPEEDKVRQLTLERRERGHTAQTVNFDAWNPNCSSSDTWHKDLASEVEAEAPEARGTLKKIQKLVRVKRGSQNSAEEGKTLPDTNEKGPMTDAVFKEASPVITCIGLGKKAERKAGKELSVQLKEQQQNKERSALDMDMEALWSPKLHHQHQWNSTEISPMPWDNTYHTCQRARADPHLYTFDFTLPRSTDWDRFESLIQELDRGRGSGGDNVTPQRAVHSVAHLEMTDSMRSSSFGKFDTFRHQARQAKTEENGGAAVPSAEAPETTDTDQTKQQYTISKKMKAISMTMRKRMGKKYIKALSEEAGEDAEGDREAEGDTEASAALAKACRRSSNSLESLHSLHSGQSSSSGVTSGSEGSSNRDSLRLEEEVPYTGNFCGRARVHTDFVPSPYDTESLRLKVGDVIDIISKPPMGIWTGMLNNRVGSFKFIYVDVLEPEKEPEPRRRVFSQDRCKRPRPNTLLELLACLNLEEHASSLMLNGYQTVEDLKELKEQHLIELNMMEPEHRQRLLAATECLHEPDPNSPKDEEEDKVPMSPSEALKPELKDCPRDSGCYIPSDISDSSKDDTVNLVALNTSPAEA